MNLRQALRACAGALIILVLVVSAAAANKAGQGGSTGTGRVFFPNPVASLQDQTLTDQKDADYAALQPAYRNVTLTNLDGSGNLVGDWAVIVSETGDPAYAPDNSFVYGRRDDRFEQVMGYYWITESQKYIQSLGFGSSLRPVNKEAQRLRINQWGVDNSFATDKKDEIRLGKGGVDDAEDAEVILHEYGHAIHFAQNFSFASSEAGAISEGFGDYWAANIADILAPTPDPACIADWDSVSYDPTAPHCLRRLDANLHYPDDLVGQVHRDGRIWSQALWSIRTKLGHVKANTVILEGQFDFPGTTMTDLAQRTVSAARQIYGNGTANQVRAAFQERGILP
jgi:hypothetical protein